MDNVYRAIVSFKNDEQFKKIQDNPVNQSDYLEKAIFHFNNAVIINTARGDIIDEAALIDALQSRVIYGAALDVFENEPLPHDSPLRSIDNVLFSPHNSNTSPEVFKKVDKVAVFVISN